MGSCVSSFSQKQTKRDVGISSATYSQTTNKKPVNRFHENNNVNGSSTNNKAIKTKAIKKQKKKIHKGLIGLPSNFQHTGHIGITELRSGKVDPEKIKNQMAEVAAALSLEDLNIESPIPTAQSNDDIDNNNETPTLTPTLTSSENQIVTDNNSDNSSRPISLQNDLQFKVKRKPTLTSISLPVQQQQSSQQLSSNLNPVLDPMTEIVAALKMPIDGNFDKQNDQKLVV